MGLMDREYMNRTPEEREAEQRQKRVASVTEEQKHNQRREEMYRLMAKGNDLTFSERRRLKQIYKENQVYMARTDTYSNYQEYTYKTTEPVTKASQSQKKKSSIIPIIIFTIIDKTIGLRVSKEEEIDSLDVHEHGRSAYADFNFRI